MSGGVGACPMVSRSRTIEAPMTCSDRYFRSRFKPLSCPHNATHNLYYAIQ